MPYPISEPGEKLRFEFGDAALIYTIPDGLDLQFFMLRYQKNGKADPEIFDVENMNLEKFKGFAKDALELFVIDWENVVSGKGKAIKYSPERAMRLGTPLMRFLTEVVFDSMGGEPERLGNSEAT